MNEQYLEILKSRRSYRQFADKDVFPQTIETLLDCARHAPSAHNIQPWAFVVVRGEHLKKEIAGLTDYGRFIQRAPVCIAVFCNDDSEFYVEDGSAVTTYILLATEALGLGSCWVAGDKKYYADRVAKLLNAPAGYREHVPNAVEFPWRRITLFLNRFLPYPDVRHIFL